ncbi:hypothetical protein [Bacillus sp. M6-12]|uniref:hypothetical protein n=1 Tax=Bacillus sp. M6-12 TaxID=2054166 RepID=UPI0011581175|nr:hypothetical protein [Bacillus sp. M6-12]
MGVLTRYQQHCETSENHSDELLKTHYYKANSEQILNALEEVFNNKQKFSITSISKEHGEMLVETRTSPLSYLVATFITVRPFETAIDFNASTEKWSLIGVYPALRTYIVQAYEELNKKLTFIGAGKNS